jgi:hypothetical protein
MGNGKHRAIDNRTHNKISYSEHKLVETTETRNGPVKSSSTEMTDPIYKIACFTPFIEKKPTI